MQQEDFLLVYGVDAETNRPLGENLTVDEVVGAALAAPETTPSLADLYSQSRRKGKAKTRVPVEGVDADNLEQAGWGVVFDTVEGSAIREKLKPLLDRRSADAKSLYREFTYQPGQSKEAFLKAQNAPPTGPVKPAKMPFYLLLAGSPETIPYDVQYELDVQFAVGRIHFDDLDDYARYANAVVAAESGAVALEPRAVFFGPANEGDVATNLSANKLIDPLTGYFTETHPDWQVQSLLRNEATKSNLVSLLQSHSPPAIFFTASHGRCCTGGAANQYTEQGALVTQKAAGSNNRIEGGDVEGLTVAGMIGVHFACFGAGTPAANNFYGYVPESKLNWTKYAAPKPFVANLPKRLLANGALACIGHVDYAFGASFAGATKTAVYESVLTKLANGGRVGLAMDYFNLRHAELSVALTSRIDADQRSDAETRKDYAFRWLQNNDARGFVVVGDPAVKLSLVQDKSVQRERIQNRIGELEAELLRLRGQLHALQS